MKIEIIKGAADNPVAKFFSSPARPTPETDALISVGLENADRECVPAEFARKLERERDEARERCSKLEKTMSYSSGATTLLSRFLKVLNERNGLIQKLDAWEEIAEHLHHLVQHPAYGVDQAIRRMDVLEAYKHLKHGH